MNIFILLLGIPLACAKSDLPNIVMILTDDQDVFLDAMTPLVKTKKLLAEQGTTFSNAFVNTPICCPSRATFLTGQYMHNSGAFNNSIVGLCGGPAWQEKEKEGFAPKLQGAGYQTLYAGKYMNMYGLPEAGGTEQVPVGWDSWYGLVGNSKFYNYTISVDGVAEKHGDNYEEDYFTDLVHRRALEFLDVRDESKPLLMVLGAPASHAPFTPAPQYATEFADMAAPRIPSYNAEVGDTKHWFTRQGGPLSDSALAEVDEIFRNRWRTLLSVDDMVEGLVNRLEEEGILDNTYFIYTSDHGYHLGEFGMPIDKRQPYEFDIRIPMIIRGPNIPANITSKVPALMVDMAPTFLDIAGLPADDLDGLSLLGRVEEERRFLVEYSGEGGEGVDKGCPQWNTGEFSWCKVEFDCKCQDTFNNTYTCLRSFSNGGESMYCKFEDNEDFEEFYDLTEDPYQLDNLAPLLGEELEEQRVLMAELAKCSGQSCQQYNSNENILSLESPNLFEEMN